MCLEKNTLKRPYDDEAVVPLSTLEAKFDEMINNFQMGASCLKMSIAKYEKTNKASDFCAVKTMERQINNAKLEATRLLAIISKRRISEHFKKRGKMA